MKHHPCMVGRAGFPVVLTLLLTGCSREEPDADRAAAPKPIVAVQSGDSTGDRSRRDEMSPLVPSTRPQDLRRQITSDNAPRLLEQLRADSGAWPGLAQIFYRSWAKQDPDAAIEQARREPAGLMEQCVEAVLQVWAPSDSEAAQDWVLEEKNGALAEIFCRSLARALAIGDGAAAATWAEKLMGAKVPVAASVVMEVGNGFAANDPEAGVAWLGGLSESEARDQAFEAFFGTWATRDPAAASRYLAGLDAGWLKDLAITSLVASIAHDDDEAALLWAATLEDENLKLEVVHALQRVFETRDQGVPLPGNDATEDP